MENAVKFLVKLCCSSFLRKRSSKAPRIFHDEFHATFHETFCSCKCPISWHFSLCRRLSVRSARIFVPTVCCGALPSSEPRKECDPDGPAMLEESEVVRPALSSWSHWSHEKKTPSSGPCNGVLGVWWMSVLLKLDAFLLELLGLRKCLVQCNSKTTRFTQPWPWSTNW